ncbi:hypothetical protein [Bacillus sp. BP-3]|uniref:hypothetical protein n=1 Tax=Bacillus sp. BP-3 TaxID=3022773 RepID=UPI003FA43393
MQQVLQIIIDLEANVPHIHLEKIGSGYAQFHLSLETKEKEHVEQVLIGIIVSKSLIDLLPPMRVHE